MSEQEKNNYLSETASQINAPAPWDLQGSGYICILRSPEEILFNHSFIPNSLREKRQSNSYSLLIFVDYTQSAVGPYYELLFIPGRFNFEDSNYYFSISRIFVSSMDSVVNGRRNWGIPKELAEFEVRYSKDEVNVIVNRQGKAAVELAFQARSFLSFPFTTRFIPKVWHTLAQQLDNVTFVFCPRGTGWFRPARLIKARINAAEFPPIGIEHVIAAVNITHFKMHFPNARKIPSGL